MPGHASRDSWLKYSALGAARFDLVLFYQGINDARANNAPPEVFREDYAHYAWYETVNALASYHRTSWFALPYTLDMLRIRMRQILTKDRYDSGREPRKESFTMEGTLAVRCPSDTTWGRFLISLSSEVTGCCS